MSKIIINQQPLSYVNRLRLREVSEIELIVVHCTELPDMKTAREYAEAIHYAGTQTGNSGHFYISRTGQIDQYVPANRVAHHVRGYNTPSIGIELDNIGRYPNWFDSKNQKIKTHYTDIQINSLIQLIHFLSNKYPSIKRITGHQDLDTGQIESSNDPNIMVQRKVDPSELFPWGKVMSQINLQRWLPERT